MKNKAMRGESAGWGGGGERPVVATSSLRHSLGERGGR